jgi:cell division septal protein FtsQ
MNALAFTQSLIARLRKARVRENRRTARQSQRGKYTGGFLLAATLGVLDLGWSVLVPYAARHPYFTVGDITIDVDGRFSEQEIQEWGGLRPGMSLWEVDPAQVEARLLAHSWIQTAEVKREFPQRVYVTVKARRAVAVMLRQPLSYVDDTGGCFTGPENNPDLDLPYVSGFADLSLETPAAQTTLAEVLHLLSLTRLWQEPLSEIRWDQHQGYTLFLARRRVTIRLGWETTPEKVAQVGVALQTWPTDGPAALFDARFANQVVVRPYPDEHGQSKRDFTGPL